MKKSLLYEVVDKDTLRCKVCNHYCMIKTNSRGICGVRENIEGVLYSLNYGKTIASGVDPIKKKPIYHFLSDTKTYSLATVGCNLSCLWCQNWDISQDPKRGNSIIGKDMTPQDHVNLAIKNKCESISYTYSEPTIFLEYALDIMKLAKISTLKNIWVTNGFMSKETLKLILPLIDAMNVDLKGFDDTTSIKYCGAPITPVVENLKTIYNSGIHLEITTLIIPGVNDDVKQIEDIADFIFSLDKDIPWHISRFYPGYKMLDVSPTPLEILFRARQIGLEKGLRNIHIGNI